MTRKSWALAWSVWAMIFLLASGGVIDAPQRGDVGLLTRGSRIGTVYPGTAASEAGLQQGQPISLRDDTNPARLRARLSRLRGGDSVPLTVGENPRRQVVLTARPPDGQTVAWRLAWSVVALGFLAIGFAVGRSRRDRIGLLFLFWCGITALAVAPRPIWPADWMSVGVDWFSSSAALFLPAILVHFFALFPEGRGRRRTALARVLYVGAATLSIGGPLSSLVAPVISDGVGALGALLFAAGVVSAIGSFVVSYRTSSPRHRRRLNVLLLSSAVGILPLTIATLLNNLGPDPGGAPIQAAALLLLAVPIGFAYAIDVHQVLDFNWRQRLLTWGPSDNMPMAPPVFPAGDARATVDAVASDLHNRLGLSHSAVYWIDGNETATLATWLGDVSHQDAPQELTGELLESISRLHRPVNLEELRATLGENGHQNELASLEKSGIRALIPLYSTDSMRAVLALGSRLSEDISSAERRAGLQNYAEHASLAVEHAEFHDDRVHQAGVERELELARGIQERLMPHADPSYPTISCAGATIPSGRVGGDYYDYVDLGDRRFGVVVGDVCGKGVPAALLVSHVQAALRLRALGGTPPGLVLQGINQDLARFHQPEKFVCLAYAVVDARERLVTWANGGLNPPMLARPGSPVETLPGGDLILGVDSETTYEEHTYRLGPAESLVFLTDGIPDARHGDKDFGAEELLGCIERWAHLRAPCLRDRLLADARSYHCTGLIDDMTVCIVQSH